MNVLSVAEATGYQVGAKIPALRGRLVRVGKYKSDRNDKGPWSMQTAELADEADPRYRLRVKVWNDQQIPPGWMNQVLYIQSSESQRGGWRGATIEQDTYEWQQGQPIKIMLEVKAGDGGGWIGLPDGQQAQQPQNYPPQSRQQGHNAPGRGGPPQDSGYRSGPPQSQGRQNPPPPQNFRQPPPPQNQQSGYQDPDWVGNQQQSPDQGNYHQEPPPPQNQEPPPQRQQTQSRQPKSPEQIAAEKFDREQKAVREAAAWTLRRLNGYRLFLRAVDKLADERKETGRPLSEIQTQTMVSSMMIDASKVALFQNFPTTKEEFEKIFPPEQGTDNK